MKRPSNCKEYLGGYVYVYSSGRNGESIVLTTEDGYMASNTIVLEPRVYRALVDYIERTATKEKEKV